MTKALIFLIATIQIIFVLNTSSAFAVTTCPDLNGNYKSDDGTSDQVITEKVKNGITIFVWGDGAVPVLIDEKPHQYGPMSYLASCTETTISLRMKAQGRIINVVITKNETGYTFTSTDPNNASGTYLKN